MRRRESSVPVVAAMAVSFALGAAASDAGLTPAQVVDLRSVREVAVAPDCRTLAYTLRVQRAPDDPPGKPWSELWLAAPGANPRPFVAGKRRVSDPQWSRDGRTLSFLVAGGGPDDKTEVWEIPVDGGESRRRLEHAGSIRLHRPSPDGRWIAFVATDPETEEEKKAKESGRDWKVVDEQPKFSRLWLQDTASGAVRRWYDADLQVLDVAWLPDARTVVLRAAPTPRVDDDYMASKLYRAPLDGVPVLLAETAGKLGDLAVSPDGNRIAFLGATSLNDPLAQSLHVVPAAGGAARNLTADLEGSAAELGWVDGRTLLLVAAEGTRHALHRVDAESGRRERLAWPRLEVTDLDLCRQRAAIAAASPEHPAELFELDLSSSGPAPRRLTRSNPALEGVRLARQEAIEWSGADGLRITGVLTYPLDYREGQRCPLVLQIHGGPEGVSLDAWTTSALSPVQLLAGRGYCVLEPNYRGSQGRGVAFSKADHDDLGGKEFEDILAGIDTLASRGLIDPARVGTGGWSYGGYLSAWAATRSSERFRAAVVAAGLTNWIAFAGTTDIPREMSLVHWDSWWFDEAELHWQRSPLAQLGRAHTPTLIVHGEKDERVHPEQSLELYTALRIKQVPTRLVLYPREPHGLDERAHQIDFIERVLAWFGEHL